MINFEPDLNGNTVFILFIWKIMFKICNNTKKTLIAAPTLLLVP